MFVDYLLGRWLLPSALVQRIWMEEEIEYCQRIVTLDLEGDEQMTVIRQEERRAVRRYVARVAAAWKYRSSDTPPPTAG